MPITEVQVYSVEEADGAGGVCVVRCVGGVARVGQLYAAGESRIVLRRAERWGRAVPQVDAGHSAKVWLRGPVVALLGKGQVIRSVPVHGLGIEDAEFWLGGGVGPADQGDLHSVRVLSVNRLQDGGLQAEERVRWGRVALLAIEGIGGHPFAAAHSAAMVRAYLIRHLGPDLAEPDRLRDPAGLCRFVLERVGTDPEEAVRAGRVWRDLDRERIVHLRRVKGLLGALEAARPHLVEGDPLGAAVDAWLRVRVELP
ncbi:hypothetical protein [Streptomyces sp. NPDC048603]|uniref:hypothetical protein n=1 Tax=Streptomyces sp. NPDC048603 TaxID=3365577 RepID=UPI00371DF89D